MSERPQNKNLRRGGPGRKPGQKTQRTKAIEAASKELVEDPGYRESLKNRLREGKAPHMETLLHHYAYGKPKERVEVSPGDGAAMLLIQLKWDDHADDVTDLRALPASGRPA